MTEKTFPTCSEIVAVNVGPEDGPGSHVAYFEAADGSNGYASIRPARDGRPLSPGERILDVRGERPDGAREVREVYRQPNGPPRVTSDAYRKGYEACFGPRAGSMKEVN